MSEIEVIIKIKKTDKATNLFSRPKTYSNEMFTSQNPQTGHSINSSVDGLFMYVVSFDVPLEINDWVYDIKTNELFQFKANTTLLENDHAKVMSTNDPKVNGEHEIYNFKRYLLPNLSVSFMDFYNDSHNVGVEYEKIKVPYLEKKDIEVYYKYPFGDCTREIGTGVYKVEMTSRNIKVVKTNLLFK